jgi:hypothetical protein
LLGLEVVEPLEIEQEDPETVKPCTANNHPTHENFCPNRALYVIIATCPVCEPRHRPLCALHCADYLPVYINNGGWCPCDPHDAPHATLTVTVRGL